MAGVGIETEYQLLANRQPIDATDHIDPIARHLATESWSEGIARRRLADGRLFMADNGYVELAGPPEPWAADAPARLATGVVDSQNELLAALERHGGEIDTAFALKGVSTHVNVGLDSAPDPSDLARRVALSFGPALLLLTALPDTLSIVLRPRPGRLELVAEFVADAEQLQAAVLLLAVATVVMDSTSADALPRLPAALLRPSPLRYGYQLVADDASAGFRHEHRRAQLTDADGRPHALDDWLARLWQAVAPVLDLVSDAGGRRHVHDFLIGARKTTFERPLDPQAGEIRSAVTQAPRPVGPLLFHRSLRMRRIGAARVRPHYVDWRFLVMAAEREAVVRYVTIPREDLSEFAAGALDGRITEAIAGPPLPLLATPEQASEIASFAAVDADTLSAALERVVQKGKKKLNPQARVLPGHTVEIYRLGDYSGPIAKHRSRPYYHERALDPKQGAEILVRPQLPPESHLEAVARFPGEIKVQPRFTVRGYTKPDFSTWIDFTGPPSVNVMGSVVTMNITSPEPVWAWHFIRIHYEDLMKLKGQAVKVAISVGPAAALQLDDAEGGNQRAAVRRVNLLIYNRDLGNAAVGHAENTLDADHLQHNAANGNAHLPVSTTATSGHGYAVSLDLHYNTLHSSYGAALRDLSVYNSVPLSEIRADYDSWLFGPGWTCSYDLRLFEYIVAEGANNEKLLFRREYVCHDGNRIQFQRLPSGEYQPLFETEVFAADPDTALSLVLRQEGSGFLLRDKFAHTYKFDGAGRIVEIGDLRTANGKLQPAKIAHQPGEIAITDSMGRVTRLTVRRNVVVEVSDPAGAATGYGYIWLPDACDGLAYPDEIPLLQSIRDPIQRSRSFTYDSYFYFMLTKTNRRSFEVALAYYGVGGPPAGVGADVAQWFWGRFAIFTDGDHVFSFNYRADWPLTATAATGGAGAATAFTPSATGQPIEIVDPARISTFHHIDLLRMGVNDHWVAPKYGGPLRRRWLYEYRDATKALLKVTDDWGGVTEQSYEAANGPGRGKNLKRQSLPDGETYTYTYTAANLCETMTTADNDVTTYTYDAMGSHKRMEQPQTVLVVDAASDATSRPVTTYRYDDLGRLEWQIDPRGLKTSFDYGGAGDPGPCGLPTGEHREIEAGGATEDEVFTYTKVGEHERHENTTTGLIVVAKYDQAHRHVGDETSGIMVEGAPGSYIETFGLNEHDQIESISDSMGRTETAQFDRFDLELKRVTRSGAAITTIARDGHGNPTRVRDLTGFVKEYDHDEQDRLLRIGFPLPLGGNDQMADFTREYRPDERKIVERQGSRSTTYVHDAARRPLDIIFADSGGEVGRLVHTYRKDTSPHTVTRKAGGGRILHKMTYERDHYGRTTAIIEEVAGDERRTEIAYDSAGNIGRVKPPRFGASPAAAPRLYMEYDGLNRRRRIEDSYGRVVERIDHDDAARSVSVYHQDAAQEETDYTSDALVLVATEAIDARGNTLRETSHGQTVTYELDARGRMIRMRGGDQRVRVAKTYTPMDGVETVTGLRTIYSVNAGGTIVVDRGTATTTYRYDAMGNLVFMQQPGRPPFTYQYDEMGRRSEERRNGGFYLAVAYDHLGRVKDVRDAEGGVNHFAYDEAARSITATYKRGPAQEVRTFTMDDSGWLKTYGSSQSPIAMEFVLRGDGSPTDAVYKLQGAELGRVKFGYDEGGNRSTKEFNYAAANDLTRHSFDANARLKKLTTFQVADIRFRYNAAGLLRRIDRDTGDTDRSQFSYAATGELQNMSQRTRGQPNTLYQEFVDQFDFEHRPTQVRTSFILSGNPAKHHRRNITNIFTGDGTHFQESVEDSIDQDGITTKITTQTALNAGGDPFLVRETTEVLAHPDALIVGKSSLTETKMTYRADGKLTGVERSAGDFDGTVLQTSTMAFGYDAMGRVKTKNAVQNDLKRSRTLKDDFTFAYDGFGRLASVDVTETLDGTAKHLKTVRYFYGPQHELLGESRDYHDSDFKTWIEANAYLTGRPNPLYYLHDGTTEEVQIDGAGKRYFYTIKAPGGYPLAAIGPDGATYVPHQDGHGSTVLFSDEHGGYRTYLPFHQGETPDRASHVAVQGSRHRLGDGALAETWGYWVVHPLTPVTPFGDHLPFATVPIDPVDLTSFADGEIGLYGHHRLTQLTISERAWNILKKLFYLTPVGMIFLMVRSYYDTIQRRFLQFESLGFSTFESSVEAMVAGIGDYVGYTELAEGIAGVDLTTASGLDAKERWLRGIRGAASIILSFVGAGLKGVSAAKLLVPATRMQRLLRGIHIAYTAWQIGQRVWGRVQLALSLAEIIRHDLLDPDDPELHLSENAAWLFKWSWAENRLKRARFSAQSVKQKIFLRTVQRLYEEGLEYHKGRSKFGGNSGLGNMADRYVRVKLRRALGRIERGEPIVKGSTAHALVTAGVLREHLHFGGPGQELGGGSKINIDILWTKGKVAVEFKQTIHSLTSPGRWQQHRFFLSHFRGRRYWFGYVGQRDPH